MKVNIIIPTYQRHLYLLSLLRDIRHQTYTNYSIFVCSDGPDMELFNIISQFNDQYNLSIIYLHTPNPCNDWGISPRKLALSQIKDSNSVVCFIDDDNSISNRYLDTLVTPFIINPNLNISIGQIYLADPEVNGERVLPVCQLQPNHCYPYGYIDPLSLMIKTDIVKEHIDEWGISRDHDYNFMKTILTQYSNIFTPGIIGVHR